jgi:hypothetical protein
MKAIDCLQGTVAEYLHHEETRTSGVDRVCRGRSVCFAESGSGTSQDYAASGNPPEAVPAEYLWENASPHLTMRSLFRRRLLEGIACWCIRADLGCGNGAFLSMLRGRGWTLVDVDLSTFGIAIAKWQCLTSASRLPMPLEI